MYQVIARKYRPQTFEEVVGQAHIKQTLRNAIDQRRAAHGYIFSGPRGTGKTTMARILAMALNCEDGPSSSPDPQSPVCQEIAAGSALDVVEIDAASNRRIDDIRELRESVKFRPVRDRYKVFIIDEAHQITTDAFNALLKTLEEPPDWTVFVFCTTEPQAIPATIVSRCQSFAFRTVDLPDVLGHLQKICAQEGIEADDDALLAIALAGDGSIRDSLSTLDQAIAACGRRLEVQEVRDLLGAIPSEMTDRILAAIRDTDPAAMIAVGDDLFREGRHPQHFCGELIRQFRNLMVMKVAGSESKLVAATTHERAAADTWLEEYSNEDLVRYVQILLALYQDLQNATQQRFRLEIGLLKLVYAGRLRPIEEVLSGLAPKDTKPRARPAPKAASAVPKQTAPRTAEPVAPTTTPASPKVAPVAPATPAPRPTPPPDAVSAGATPSTKPPGDAPPPVAAPKPDSRSVAEDDFGPQVIAVLEESDAAFLIDALRASQVTRKERVVTICTTDDWETMIELNRTTLEAALFGLVGGRPDVRIVRDDGDSSEPGGSETQPASAARASAPAVGENELHQRALSDPGVLEFQNRFEGKVTNVLDLRTRS